VNPYLWNLLPDNDEVLRTWARNFGVRKNAFALLSFTGEDLPGAAQIVRPERLEALAAEHEPVVQWLDEEQIAQRLRELRVDRTAWLRPGDVGYFSLAGAQPKMALHRQGDRWGILHPVRRSSPSAVNEWSTPLVGLRPPRIRVQSPVRDARALGAGGSYNPGGAHRKATFRRLSLVPRRLLGTFKGHPLITLGVAWARVSRSYPRCAFWPHRHASFGPA